MTMLGARGLMRSLALRSSIASGTLAQAPIAVACRCNSTIGYSNKPFFDKQKKLQRPLSPHLSIYSPQLTSVLSISTRITGNVCTFGMSGAAILLAASPHDFTHYVEMVHALDMAPEVSYGLKWLIAFPFTFHSFNGLRHLMWDNVTGLTLSSVYKSGYVVLGASAIGSSVLSMM